MYNIVPTPVPVYLVSFYLIYFANPKSASFARPFWSSIFWVLMSLWVILRS